MKNYSCYLFDADGTLIDTMELIYQSYRYTLSLHNRNDISREEIYRGVGIPLRTVLEGFLGKKDDEEYEAIRKKHNDYQSEIAPQYIKLFPGVKEVLGALRAKGKHCVVVTSRMQPTLSAFFKMLGIHDFFDHFVTPVMTEKHKPHPEPVLKALELCGASPDHALMTGDTIYDIQSASGAGVDTCFVNWSLTPILDPDIKPVYYINSFAELLLL